MNNYQNSWPGFGEEPTRQYVDTTYMDRSVAKVMRSVYMRMFFALLVTAATAFFCASSPLMIYLIFGNRMAWIVLLIAEVGLVVYLSSRLHKISETTASLLFYVYSILNGVVLSSVLLIYTGASIATTFMITAGVFGAMSVYGYVTGADLSRMGSILFMALIGLVVVSVVNMFMHSSQLEWIISFAGVVIFIGLTAWDTQNIRLMVTRSYATGSSAELSKLATIGALSLYLDFVNLFLHLLRFFGASRD